MIMISKDEIKDLLLADFSLSDFFEETLSKDIERALLNGPINKDFLSKASVGSFKGFHLEDVEEALTAVFCEIERKYEFKFTYSGEDKQLPIDFTRYFHKSVGLMSTALNTIFRVKPEAQPQLEPLYFDDLVDVFWKVIPQESKR